MKLRSIALFVALVLLAGVSAPALAASNPFADVPADHWAYDAIIELAAVGLVEGYPDGTYGGSRMLTRYEAAMVFARTLARLESLVEAGVKENTDGMREQITQEVLKDIEAAKASLAELIRAELDKIEIPVVEKTVVEQPIEIREIVERQPIERPFQVTPEVEDAIRKLVGEQTKDLLAQVEEAAKQTVVETKIIERVVDAEGLTAEDVEKIAEELLVYHLGEFEVLVDRALRENINQDRRIDRLEEQITNRLNNLERGQEALEGDIAYVEGRLLGLIEGLRYDVDGLQAALDEKVYELTETITDLTQELELELALLGVRVESLEFVTGQLDNRLTDLEEDYAGFKAETERIQLSGSLNFEVTDVSANWGEGDYGDTILDPDYEAGTTFTQEVTLNLAVQASDSVKVNAFLEGSTEGNSLELDNFTLDTFGVEVLSDSPVHRLVVGSLDDDEIGDRFSSYVLSDEPAVGLLADANLFGLEANAVADNTVLGFAGKYAFAPELGLKGQFVTGLGEPEFKDNDTFGLVGLFGKVLGVEYGLDYAVDNTDDQTEDNSLVDLDLGAEVGPFELYANWVRAEVNFANHGFVTEDLNAQTTKMAYGASTEFLGINLSADFYQEKEKDASDELVKASRFGYEQEIDLVLPFTITGVMAKAQEGSSDAEEHREFKIAVEDLSLFGTGFTVGASFANVKNRLDDDWKVADDYTGVDANIVTADLGYELGLGTAILGLDYGIEYAMIEDKETDDEVIHSVGAAYGFANDLTLSLNAERFINISKADGEENTTVNQVKAGLEFKF